MNRYINVEGIGKLRIKFNHVRLSKDDPDRLLIIKDATSKGQISGSGNRRALMKFSVVTICRFLNIEKQVLATGYSFCGPKDNFCKEVGRNKSMGRAIADLTQSIGQFSYHIAT